MVEKHKIKVIRAKRQLDEYLDLQTFLRRYPQFKEGQMRWFVVKKDRYGLTPAIKRLGRRLYFHVPTFLEWLQLYSLYQIHTPILNKPLYKSKL